MKPSERVWSNIRGNWNWRDDNHLEQSEITHITRYATDIGHGDFVVTFTFQLTDILPNANGEAKFIYADADEQIIETESYRIDFIHGISLCRVLAGSLMLPTPLQLVRNTEYKVRVCLKDNLLSVNVNGINIVERFNIGRRSNGKVGFGTFQARATFSDISIQSYTQKKCFVVMPFNNKRNLLYDLVIEPVLRTHPNFLFEFLRADEARTTGRISEEIGQWIKDADVIVADITENNRNVFYELGFAHAIGRKAILLIEKHEGVPLDIPFDISDFRCHSYELSSTGFHNLRIRLAEILQNVLGQSNAL